MGNIYKNISKPTAIDPAPHPACDVVATSYLGLIKVETSRTMPRRYHDVATGTSMRRTYLRRLCDVSLVHE